MTKAEYAILAAGAACVFALFAPIRGKADAVYAIYNASALKVAGSVEDVQKCEHFLNSQRVCR